jgi:hypothetical protein
MSAVLTIARRNQGGKGGEHSDLVTTPLILQVGYNPGTRRYP